MFEQNKRWGGNPTLRAGLHPWLEENGEAFDPTIFQ